MSTLVLIERFPIAIVTDQISLEQMRVGEATLKQVAKRHRAILLSDNKDWATFQTLTNFRQTFNGFLESKDELAAGDALRAFFEACDFADDIWSLTDGETYALANDLGNAEQFDAFTRRFGTEQFASSTEPVETATA